jgi:hypothetical protein
VEGLDARNRCVENVAETMARVWGRVKSGEKKNRGATAPSESESAAACTCAIA